MKTITYKSKEYPVRTFLVESTELGGVIEKEITISVQSLIDAMGNDVNILNSQAQKIDMEIYFYIEDDTINHNAEEICNTLLDTPYLFIEEIN